MVHPQLMCRIEKTGRNVWCPREFSDIQRDLEKLQKWAKRTSLCSAKGMQSCTLEETIWETPSWNADLQKRPWAFWWAFQVEHEPAICSCSKAAKGLLGCIRPAGWGKGSFALLRNGEAHLECWLQLWSSQYETWTYCYGCRKMLWR